MTDHPIFHGILKVADSHLVDGKGRDVMRLPGGPQRLADCANALKDIWFPLAHVPAMENRIERLEHLRKEAVARLDNGGNQNEEITSDTFVAQDVEAETCGANREKEITRSGQAQATSAPALLRLEPAGEASASPWRFDMENAPRGSVTVTTRQGKTGPIEVKTPKREVIFVASEDGHVTQSYWVPDAERWCMFTKDRPPIAWMALPTFTVEALRRVAA